MEGDASEYLESAALATSTLKRSTSAVFGPALWLRAVAPPPVKTSLTTKCGVDPTLPELVGQLMSRLGTTNLSSEWPRQAPA